MTSEAPAYKWVLNGRQALTLLKKVTLDKGADHRYQAPDPDKPGQCYNVWEGQPSCIVGHVLAELGLDAGSYERYGVQDREGVLSTAYRLNTSDFPWHISPIAQQVLLAAQAAQDDGASWGFAVLVAEDVLGKIVEE